MKENKYILISNIALPSQSIGSWTKRITTFINNTNFFDVILSPSKQTKTNTYCKKRKFIVWNKKLRSLNLLNWVAKDYIKSIASLSKTAKQLTLVIMDDPHLLEAITILKNDFNCPITIIFSYHGYELNISDNVLNKVDKILFLTESGYKATLKKKYSFIPEVEIVGNSVDSDQFYPLDKEAKTKQKKMLGFAEADVIVTWMSNERPIKGLHLFKKISKLLLQKYPEIKILIIGTKIKEDAHPNMLNLGQIENIKVAEYLQISDFYFFTTLVKEGFGLSLVEAVKAGCKVITSNNGAVAEVVKGMENVYINTKPNIVNSWVTIFDSIYKENKQNISKKESQAIWNYEAWEKKFKKAILTNG